MLCSLASNFVHTLVQFMIRTEDIISTPRPLPPWHSVNNADQDTPPWQNEGCTTHPINQTDRQSVPYNDWDTPAAGTSPPPLWMDDERESRDTTRPPATNTGIRDSETDWQATEHRHDYSGYYTEEQPIRHPSGQRSFPSGNTIFGTDKSKNYDSKHASGSHKKDKKVNELPLITEPRRSWPEPNEKGERRIVAATYSAVEIHGFFGLIDDGSVGEGRMLIVHVPKWIRGYFLDIKQGDTLHVYHAKGKKISAALQVLSTGRHKYYAPGRKVTTCTVCVSEEQWAPFSR